MPQSTSEKRNEEGLLKSSVPALEPELAREPTPTLDRSKTHGKGIVPPSLAAVPLGTSASASASAWACAPMTFVSTTVPASASTPSIPSPSTNRSQTGGQRDSSSSGSTLCSSGRSSSSRSSVGSCSGASATSSLATPRASPNTVSTLKTIDTNDLFDLDTPIQTHSAKAISLTPLTITSPSNKASGRPLPSPLVPSPLHTSTSIATVSPPPSAGLAQSSYPPPARLYERTPSELSPLTRPNLDQPRLSPVWLDDPPANHLDPVPILAAQTPIFRENIFGANTTAPSNRKFGSAPRSIIAPDETQRRATASQVSCRALSGASGVSVASRVSIVSIMAARGGGKTSRTASMDSAMSSISSKHSQDGSTGAADIANLIKTAGSPEAVIQYLLKEKQSQAQQNSQLWRLVDKQRAMILGLNKDLERAMKEKERYRKKMKEVMVVQEQQQTKVEALSSPSSNRTSNSLPNNPAPQDPEDLSRSSRSHREKTTIQKSTRPIEIPAPASPNRSDSDSMKHSPIDMNLAPYPITPPADLLSDHLSDAALSIGARSAVHTMPVSSEHAVDNFDLEKEEDRVVDQIKNAKATELEPMYHVALPPSRSLTDPRPSPSESTPAPPLQSRPGTASGVEATSGDRHFPNFTPSGAPPLRKPPPAPLQLNKAAAAPRPPTADDENETDDSELDTLLDVRDEKRGRRRTREEDEQMRDMLITKEGLASSLSGQSSPGKTTKGAETLLTKSNGEDDGSGGYRDDGDGTVLESDSKSSNYSDHPVSTSPGPPASTTPVITGHLTTSEREMHLTAPLKSPGLPASPRPQYLNHPDPLSSTLSSPSLAPAPLSPRPPRQPLPLPQTPLSANSVSGADGPMAPLPSLHVAKKESLSSQYGLGVSRNNNVDRRQIYQGLASDEHPDLLLPPNALPSIAISVASSRMKPSRASLISLTQLEEDPVFTLAICLRSTSEELWRVEKDIISLAKLDHKLKQSAAFTARTPDRSLFSGHAPAKLDARRIALNQYFEDLVNTAFETKTAMHLCWYLSTNTLPPNSDDASAVVEAAVDHGAPKTGPGGRPLKSGYLTKKGKNFGGWKARFFVLDSPNLKYYETPGGAHLGTIKLLNAQIGKQSPQGNDIAPAPGMVGDDTDNQYRHAFLVLEPKKKDSTSHVRHVLCAESDSERDQWVNALLRWIDYKEPGDESSTGHERHGSKDQHVNGLNAKRKLYSQPKSQSTSQDALIGISYESSKQGQPPGNGLPAQRGGGGTPEPVQDRSASYSISAPRDPQLISDSSTWGSKFGVSTGGPSAEEKKQRKRSFFGFGPKSRTYSDDQDSVFSASGSVQSNEYRGPVRQVFGAPLSDAVRFNGPIDVQVPLPAVVYRCIQYLDHKNAISEEGIFRLSGSNVVIKQLRERFNTEGDINLIKDDNFYDIHAVASLLKLYLRELPTTILTRDLHLRFLAVTEMADYTEKMVALAELMHQLPLANGTLLRYLIAFLVKIINNCEVNKMTVRNVGIVFSPTLNIPAPVFALLLQNYEPVFGIDPEEYELPSPSDETESRAPSETLHRRPSTAGAASSPSRNRLNELQQLQRSTPTPPPTSHRATPTPPPGGGPQISQEHEVDSSQYLDQSHSTKAKRRESSMLMGNMMLNHQGSRSRLREETRLS